MRKKMISLVTGVCMLPALNAFAATSSKYSETDLENAIQKLMQQTEELQKEVKSLKAELNQVKQKNQTLATSQKTPSDSASNQTTAQTATQTTNVATNQPSDQATQFRQPARTQTALTNVTTIRGPLEETETDKAEVQKEIFISHLIGSPVLTSPLLSLQSSDNASDLLVNYSTINEDLTLLQDKQKLEQAIGAENMPSYSRPLLILSGKIESQLTYQMPYGSNSSSKNSLALSGIELDAYAMVGKWASGLISISFNNSPLDPLLVGSGNPANNGVLFVERGFFTVGNLQISPIYLTAGQTYLPFGRYSTYMLSNPSTKVLGRADVPAIILGFYQDGIFAQAYIFDGATDIGTSNSGVDGAGLNVGYKFDNTKYNGTFGMGIMGNLADTQGAQSTGGSGFVGFSENATTENLQHQVPGFDVNGSFGMGPFNLAVEYITATRSYSATDLTFNGEGATPKAFHAELDYIFDIATKPSSFALSYDQTWQALALALPKNSYTATFNTSIWKNTIQTLEFRHDVNYPSTDTAGGICDPGFTGTPSFCFVPSVGSTQNTILAQMGIYF